MGVCTAGEGGTYTEMECQNGKGGRRMPEKKADEERRQSQGDVDDLIFHGEPQAGASDR